MTIELLAIAALTLSISAVWWPVQHAWAGIYAVFLCLALLAEWIEPIGLVSLGVFALVVWVSTLNKPRYLTIGVNTVVVFVTLVAAARIAPGLTNILLLENTQLSTNTGWSALRFSADKASIGLFFLVAYRNYLCKTLAELARVIASVATTAIAGCIIIYATGIAVGFATIDISLSPIVVLWLFRNLVFTVVAEEVFFRGFIQNGLQRSIPSTRAPIYALFGSALAFGTVHIYGGWQYGLLATMAGMLYGYVFMKTGRIEASIAAHGMLNTGHIILLSYP